MWCCPEPDWKPDMRILLKPLQPLVWALIMATAGERHPDAPRPRCLKCAAWMLFDFIFLGKRP